MVTRFCTEHGPEGLENESEDGQAAGKRCCHTIAMLGKWHTELSSFTCGWVKSPPGFSLGNLGMVSVSWIFPSSLSASINRYIGFYCLVSPNIELIIVCWSANHMLLLDSRFPESFGSMKDQHRLHCHSHRFWRSLSWHVGYQIIEENDSCLIRPSKCSYLHRPNCSSKFEFKALAFQNFPFPQTDGLRTANHSEVEVIQEGQA